MSGSLLSGVLGKRWVSARGLLRSRFLTFVVGCTRLIYSEAALVWIQRLSTRLLGRQGTLGSVLAQLAGLRKVTLHGRAAVVRIATRLGTVRPQTARVLLLTLGVRLVPLPVVARSIGGSGCHHSKVWCPLVLPVERALLADLDRHTRLVMSFVYLLLARQLPIAEVLGHLISAIWRDLAQMGLNLNLAPLKPIVMIEIGLLVAVGLPGHRILWNLPDCGVSHYILL